MLPASNRERLSMVVLAIGWYLVAMATMSWVFWPGFPRVIFCDVGQGDATLIISGSTQVLIDGGRDQLVAECLEQYLPWWDRQLELVVATHADADHIGGLDQVLSSYRVLGVMITPWGKQTADFDRLYYLIQAKNTQEQMDVFFPQPGLEFIVDTSLALRVLSPQVPGVSNQAFSTIQPETQLWDVMAEHRISQVEHNDLSMGLFMTLEKVGFLLMADIEHDAELALLNDGLLPEVDILKVGHHGSKTSTTGELLHKTRPEHSVISAGKNNSYGHPAREVVQRLDAIGSKVWRTDWDGDVVVMIDNDGYQITTTRGGSMRDGE